MLRALPGVAREAICAHLEDREPVALVEPVGELARSRAVFVTLKIDGVLRGCMGELAPRHDNLVDETMERAVVAALRDPRFPRLSLAELEQATIDVTILEPLERVASVADLDPRRFGVEVSDAAGRRAVLLPGIDGIETAEQHVALAKRKAEIPADADVVLRRFRAHKIEE